MQAYRGPLVATANDGNHLPVTKRGGLLDHSRQKGAADAAAALRGVDIDRILKRKPISRARSVGGSITVSEEACAPLGNEIRQSSCNDVTTSPRQFFELRRDLLERRDPVKNMIAVDCGNR